MVQKPRTFCRPAGDRVLVETVLFNATQNARLHGGDAPVQVSAAFSCHDEDCDLRLEVINVAGRNHQQLRALRVQELLAALLLMQQRLAALLMQELLAEARLMQQLLADGLLTEQMEAADEGCG